MRIRKRFPSFPIIPSSVSSSEVNPTEQGEMEVSSSPPPPAPAEKITSSIKEPPTSENNTSRKLPLNVETDWELMKAAAHRLLKCSSYNFRVQAEHSSTNPVSNGEKPSKKMVIEEEGGKAQKKCNCSSTNFVYSKKTNVSSSSYEGGAKGKDEKAESSLRVDGRRGLKQKLSSLKQAGSPRCGCDEKNDEHSSSSACRVKKKVKRIRSLTSIYADIGSLMPSFSTLLEMEEAD